MPDPYLVKPDRDFLHRVLEAGGLEGHEVDDIIRDSFAGAILVALHLKPDKMHEKLLAVWEEFGIRATLFPDICSVWRYRELEMQDYADTFETQMRDAARSGHDVQLHLHHEWRSAAHEAGAWRFVPRTGSLHDLGFRPEDDASAPALVARGSLIVAVVFGGISTVTIIFCPSNCQPHSMGP